MSFERLRERSSFPLAFFLYRGDVQTCRPEVQLMIHVPTNCVVVHSGSCHLDAQHENLGKITCARQIVRYEGYANVMNWLKEMEKVMKGRVPGDEIQWLSQQEKQLCQIRTLTTT